MHNTGRLCAEEMTAALLWLLLMCRLGGTMEKLFFMTDHRCICLHNKVHVHEYVHVHMYMYVHHYHVMVIVESLTLAMCVHMQVHCTYTHVHV